MIYLNNNTEQQMISIPRTTVLTDSATTNFATEAYVDNAIEAALSGLTSEQIIAALGYTPCRVTAITDIEYLELETKDPNTIYGIIDE